MNRIAIGAALLLLIGCSDKKYADNFSKADQAVREGFAASERLALEYQIYWDSGLDEAKKEAAKSGAWEASGSGWAKAIHAMEQAKNPPARYKDANAKLAEAFGIYEAFFSYVENPSGDKADYATIVSEEKRKFHFTEGQVYELTP